jgi:hypothetical protein
VERPGSLDDDGIVEPDVIAEVADAGTEQHRYLGDADRVQLVAGNRFDVVIAPNDAAGEGRFDPELR